MGFVISRLLAARRNPDLIAERARFVGSEDTKDWDKKLAPLVILGSGLIPLVVGLQAVFGSSPAFSLPVKSIALVTILLGYALGSYALIENRFFSAMVRIQAEGGHQMVSSGPYRWMRHPGYAGAFLTYWASAFLLESTWAFLPVLFVSVLLVIRTRLEDRTLQDELEGYSAYAQKVRYRLLPGVW